MRGRGMHTFALCVFRICEFKFLDLRKISELASERRRGVGIFDLGRRGGQTCDPPPTTGYDGQPTLRVCRLVML